MSENRRTEIEDIELVDEIEEDNSVEQIRDELFEKLKISLLDEDRLIKKFYKFCNEYCEFDYDEMGLDFEEGEGILRRANKIREKLLLSLEEKIQISFDDVSIDTLHTMIIAHTKYQEQSFKIVIEIFEDSFDLEIV